VRLTEPTYLPQHDRHYYFQVTLKPNKVWQTLNTAQSYFDALGVQNDFLNTRPNSNRYETRIRIALDRIVMN